MQAAAEEKAANREETVAGNAMVNSGKKGGRGLARITNTNIHAPREPILASKPHGMDLWDMVFLPAHQTKRAGEPARMPGAFACVLA